MSREIGISELALEEIPSHYVIFLLSPRLSELTAAAELTKNSRQGAWAKCTAREVEKLA